MIRLLATILCLLPSLTVLAQYTSKYGRFEVNEIRGCAPLSVNLSIVAPSVCDAGNPCSMDFEGNNGFQNLTFSHTYTAPGRYWLRVLFQAIDLDSIEIEVFPDIPPSYELYTCGNNAVRFRVTDTNYSQYVVNFNDASPEVVVPVGALATGMHTFASSGAKTIDIRGRNLTASDNCSSNPRSFTAVPALTAPFISQLTVTDNSTIQLDFIPQSDVLYRLEIARNNNTTFQQVQNLYNTSTATVSNLDTDNEYYCFRIGAFDPCNGTIAYSNIICSSDFDLTLQDGSNLTRWITAMPGIQDFQIVKDNVPFLAVPTPTSSYTDIDIVCNTNYCYQLRSIYANGSQSISLVKCGTSFSTTVPSVVADITASVTDAGVALEWTQDMAFTPVTYSIAKSLEGGAFVPVLQSSTQNSLDPAYVQGSHVCYQIRYTDICSNQSPLSASACVIALAATLESDNSITLTWNDYSGWQNGVQRYVIEKYTPQGVLLASIDAGTATSYVDDITDLVNQAYVYVVRAEANDAGLSSAYSNEAAIIKEPNLYYPTAFTPNGDGLNDIFVVFGQYIIEFNLRIFNRWGEMLFSTTSLTEGWNGTYNGSLMPEGTYAFEATLTDFAGRTYVRSGTVLLLNHRKQ